MNEIKIVLVMTVRSFKIKPAYEDFDKTKLRDDKYSERRSNGIGVGPTEPRLYRGDRAYQTEKAGAHPSEGYPCYISTV
jgi:hypothetical protein